MTRPTLPKANSQLDLGIDGGGRVVTSSSSWCPLSAFTRTNRLTACGEGG